MAFLLQCQHKRALQYICDMTEPRLNPGLRIPPECFNMILVNCMQMLDLQKVSDSIPSSISWLDWERPWPEILESCFCMKNEAPEPPLCKWTQGGPKLFCAGYTQSFAVLCEILDFESKMETCCLHCCLTTVILPGTLQHAEQKNQPQMGLCHHAGQGAV